MSRLWNRPRFCLYAGDSHVVVCRVEGRWRPRLQDKAIVPFASGQLLPALESWWQTHAAAADVELVLGSSHVRYLMLPWDPQLARPELRQSVAAALFARQFQEDPAHYQVRFATARYGKPQLATFVSTTLLSGLDRVFAGTEGRLHKVEPLLVAVWNRFSSRLGKDNAVLLLAEEDRLLKVFAEQGDMMSLQLRPCAETELQQQLQLSAGTGRIFAPGMPALAARHPDAWLALPEDEGFRTAQDGDYAYALCGVF